MLCGDAPFIDAETISDALVIHTQQGNAVTVITAELEDPKSYGRIIRTESGISGIVEKKDASEEQLKIKEVNSEPTGSGPQTSSTSLEKLQITTSRMSTTSQTQYL